MRFNRRDSRTIVPRRGHLGWTLNLARPLAWLIVIMLVGAAVVISHLNRSGN